ncbi:MAG: hypothetical protein HOW73_35520 [Polyangiaceae bacterium]|nr:hypothetical protein [Polyangiaceae bacterium]
MREARDKYFDINGFGVDGGYSDAWVDFHIGPLYCPFPNTKSRIRAVKVHDLHHILTGYQTDFIGELEIGAWEVGAGCKDFAAAWFLNLSSLGAGVLFAPSRVYRAFIRGRSTDSLYGRPLDDMLGRTVAEMRRDTNVDASAPEASFADRVAFAGYAVAGLAVSAVAASIGVFVVPVGLVTGLVRKLRRAPA